MFAYAMLFAYQVLAVSSVALPNPVTVLTLDIPLFPMGATSDGGSGISVATEDAVAAESGSVEVFASQKPKKCPNCHCGVVNRKQRIVGGQPTEQNEFPWMASLSRKGKFYCGATVITKQHLLTAAHCVEGIVAGNIKATVGEFNKSSKHEPHRRTIRISHVYRHPDFQISHFKNDIAVLKLESPLSFDSHYVQPACLPNFANRDYAGMNAIVSGWGRTGESKPTSSEVRKVQVPIISIEECRKTSGYAPSRITDNMMCAGYPEGKKDSCQGDSGGPLQISGAKDGTMEVIGIVSWGRGCARPNYPGIYTRVASYMDWVDEQIGSECSCKGS